MIRLTFDSRERLAGGRRGAQVPLSRGERVWSCVPASAESRALKDIGRDGRAVRIEPGSRDWASWPAKGLVWLITDDDGRAPAEGDSEA